MSRVIPGMLLAGGWLLLLLLGSSSLFWGVLVLGTGLGLREFFRMACPSLTGTRLIFTVFACLLSVLASLSGAGDIVLCGTMASLLALAAIALHGFSRIENVLCFLTSGVFASIYISLCVAHLVLIRFLDQGPFWLLMLIVIVAGSDTGAYYAGRAFGKRKLFPHISPKKTVAGGIGGLIAGIAAAEGINLLFSGNVHPLTLLVAASILIVIGIAGDLTESMIKRSVNVKDSGTVLFGHGGILDRVDSLLLTAPVLYAFLHFGFLP